MILYRHCDPRFPFLWEQDNQPAARWHGEGEGPVQYLADTPDGAWAEFLRHEEIRTPEDVATIRRALWAVELAKVPVEEPRLPLEVLTGDRDSHAACQGEGRRLREAGAEGLLVVSAALFPGAASGYMVDGGVRAGPPRDGHVVALFGHRPHLVGWAATVAGGPGLELLPKVRHFAVG